MLEPTKNEGKFDKNSAVEKARTHKLLVGTDGTVGYV